MHNLTTGKIWRKVEDMDTQVLVVGGTGVAGRAVVRRLVAEGVQVSTLSRRGRTGDDGLPSSVTVVTGDVEDEAAVEAAMTGCTGVHLSLDGGTDPDLERRGAELVSRVAAREGVTRITLMSGASVSDASASYDGVAAKLGAEAAVSASGIAHAVFRSSFLMESLPRYVRGNRASALGKQPYPWHWVAAEDLAGMVTRAHTGVDATGTFVVLGPDALTLEQALTTYCAAVHPEAKVSTLPFWMASLLARMPGADDLAAALPFARYTATAREVGDPVSANAAFGTPATSLADWCATAARSS
jgi:uncharacterized protein YbjT (DUF2867 family)